MDEEWMDVRKTVEESHTGSSAQDWATLGGQLELPYRTAWRTPRSAAASRTSSPHANDPADGSSAEKAIQSIESFVGSKKGTSVPSQKLVD
jgi:hypothetical protein